MDASKRDLRSHFRTRRELSRPADDWHLLFATPEYANAKVIASYASFGQEPKTTSLNERILRDKKDLLLPRMKADLSLEWVSWNGNPEALFHSNNHFQPLGNPFAGELDLVIVPALAVDKSGLRLGQGGGSYDRAMKGLKVWKVALLNDEEFLDFPLPQEPHDQRVDAVVTPTRFIRI